MGPLPIVIPPKLFYASVFPRISIDDGDGNGNENVNLKMNSRFSKYCRV